MKKLTVGAQVAKKIRKGIQLLDAGDFPESLEMETVVELQDQSGQLLGTAYLSQQNKGIGWYIGTGKRKLDSVFYHNLFQAAKSKRRAYFEDSHTTAFRIFNQDGDGFGGLSIDLYGDFALFSWYNAFVYSQKETIVAAFQSVYPELAGGYEKIRFKGLDYESAHLFGQEAPANFTILENGVSYQVFLNDGLMTGIFLDQHQVRGSLVDGLAAGKSVLNMFSYTAAFSVAAAIGGAVETRSVDLAKRSRELSQAHFVANHIDLEQHFFHVMDVFEYFKYAQKKGLGFDVIVIDPPSFARNKKQTFSVVKDYHKLVSQALTILNPKGVLITSTNASNLSIEKFKAQIEKGFAGIPHKYLATYRLPSDFAVNQSDESSNYLKVFTIQVEK
ncbi:TPA: class I SAM-dependent rRNA methyltransferase [Streptococcus suis]